MQLEFFLWYEEHRTEQLTSWFNGYVFTSFEVLTSCFCGAIRATTESWCFTPATSSSGFTSWGSSIWATAEFSILTAATYKQACIDELEGSIRQFCHSIYNLTASFAPILLKRKQIRQNNLLFICLQFYICHSNEKITRRRGRRSTSRRKPVLMHQTIHHDSLSVWLNENFHLNKWWLCETNPVVRTILAGQVCLKSIHFINKLSRLSLSKRERSEMKNGKF